MIPPLFLFPSRAHGKCVGRQDVAAARLDATRKEIEELKRELGASGSK